ncbi:hypothetical protein V8F33_003335 [Rhypophila sp. PSN 637]
MADQMDIDLPEEHHPAQTTIPSPEKPNQNQPQSQQSQQKQSSSSSSSSSSIRELTTYTIKSPPFAYVHLSTVSLSSSGAPITPAADPNPATTKEEPQAIIDPLQVRSYCTAALQRFLGDTGAAIVPDILLIRSSSSSKKCQQEADIYLRLPRQDLGAFAAAITAYPGRQVSKGSGAKQDEGGWLLLQFQSCGDWLGSLIGKAEETDIWDRD